MSSKGRITDIVDVKAVEEQINKTNALLDTIVGRLSKAAEFAAILNETFKNAKGLKDLNEAQRQYAETQKKAAAAANDLKKAADSLDKQRTKAYEAQQKAIDKENRLIEAANKEAKSMDELKAKISALIVIRNRFDATTDEGKRSIEDYNARIDESKKKLSAFGSEHEKQRDNIGNYQSALKGLKAQLLATFSFAAILYGVKSFFSSAIEEKKKFESSLAELSAIVGVVGKELAWLGEQAKYLSTATLEGGISITSSASDILQAFKLMGSAKPELLSDKEALVEVTKQALILAEASKMEAGPAVEALANIMNQFGAGSKDAAMYINILAAGSKAGAAEVDDLQTSIVKFGTSADLANISIQQSVALVETLAEKGIKGEIAGNALKGMITRLQVGADEFNPKIVGINQALENLAKANLSTAEKVKIFSLENINQANVLIENRKRVIELTDAVTETQTAYEQAAVNTNTLEANTKKLSNEWTNLKLSITESDGIFSKIFTNIVSGLTNVVEGFKILNEGIFKSLAKSFNEVKESHISDAISEDKKEVDLLAKSLTEKGVPATEAQAKAIQMLILQYSKLLGYGDNVDQIKRQIDALKKMQEEQKEILKTTTKTKKQLTEEEIAVIEKAERKRREIDNKYKVDKLTSIKETYNESIDLEMNNIFKMSQLTDAQLAEEQKRIDTLKNINKDYRKSYMDDVTNMYNEEIRLDELKLEKKKAIKQREWELAREVGNSINELMQAGFQQDISNIDEKSKKDEEARKRELEAAGNNEELKKKINAKYDANEKKREQERKKIAADQAKANKMTAIFNIILSTAQAISGHLLQPWMIPFDIAMGGLQLAVAAAQPIPKYKTGRKGGKAEMAVVGEEGSEMIELASGKRFLTPDKETLTFLPAGASVIPNHELIKNIAVQNIPQYENTFNMDIRMLREDVKGLHEGFLFVANAVKNKKETHFHWKNGELRKAIQNGMSRTEYINTKFRD